ncbi:MAG: hypothetical protein IJZ10_07995, partial [Thermoguttaceae bacterium]|nr:hypothetical protein [Thermoguttaceae bacterium]
GASRDEGKSKEFLHFFFLLSCVKHITKARLSAKRFKIARFCYFNNKPIVEFFQGLKNKFV